MVVVGILVVVIGILVCDVLIVFTFATVSLVGKSWLKKETVVWPDFFPDGVDFFVEWSCSIYSQLWLCLVG